VKTALRILGTLATLIAWAGHVSRALRTPDEHTGWWLLAVSLCAAVLLLALWWPRRKEHDSDQPR
jgi:hypothetical protein